MVLTNNGKPAMLVLDISSQDFEDVIDILNRAEAMKLLDQIQSQSARAGLDAMSADQIDNEIKKYRRKARPR
ncbi:MAG: hypothetical protein LBT33_07275 [Spirochaetia bacterium]|nr:hypothetical protein [Spirochaetia bacterium]